MRTVRATVIIFFFFVMVANSCSPAFYNIAVEKVLPLLRIQKNREREYVNCIVK